MKMKETMCLEKEHEKNSDWYVMFVKTLGENRVVEQIKKVYSNDLIQPFLPRIETYHKYANKRFEKELKVMFPGYVFLQSSMDSDELYDKIKPYIGSFDNPLKLLKYGDSGSMALHDHDKEILQSLLDPEYCLKASEGIIVGDRVIIDSGALKGKESFIQKVNRKRREATIEIEMLGRVIPIKVGLNILKKVEEEDQLLLG
jgi:transcriptional antiterminator NusG